MFLIVGWLWCLGIFVGGMGWSRVGLALFHYQKDNFALEIQPLQVSQLCSTYNFKEDCSVGSFAGLYQFFKDLPISNAEIRQPVQITALQLGVCMIA